MGGIISAATGFDWFSAQTMLDDGQLDLFKASKDVKQSLVQKIYNCVRNDLVL